MNGDAIASYYRYLKIMPLNVNMNLVLKKVFIKALKNMCNRVVHLKQLKERFRYLKYSY